MTTIGRNRSKLIGSIFRSATAIRCRSLDTGFAPVRVDTAFVPTLERQVLAGAAKLLTDGGARGAWKYCAHVHSNLWYEVDSPVGPNGEDAQRGLMKARR